MRLFGNLRFTSNVLSLRVAALLVLAATLVGPVGLVLIESYTWVDAFYMAIITLSTVGFGEINPLSPAGRVFISLLVLVNIGIVAYALAAFSYYVIDGNLFQTLQRNRVQNRITRLKDHSIVCGYGRYGREIVGHLKLHGQPYVVIDTSEERLDKLQDFDEDALFLLGDATQDEVLEQAGVHRAASLLTSLKDDTENLFIVLSARELNPNIRLVSSARESRSRLKLMKAGATNVIMPEQIGGFYMATLISKPGAVEFFSFITNELAADIGFEEIPYAQLSERQRGQPIHKLHFRKNSGVNIIGHRLAGGRYEVNPEPTAVLEPGGSFIAIGNQEQLKKLRSMLGM